MKIPNDLYDAVNNEMMRLVNEPALISSCKQTLHDAGKDDKDPSLAILIAIIPHLITYAITFAYSHQNIFVANPEYCSD